MTRFCLPFFSISLAFQEVSDAYFAILAILYNSFAHMCRTGAAGPNTHDWLFASGKPNQ